MGTFLIYTFCIIALGIFVRIFWIPLLVIGGILLSILGVIVSAAITAIILQFFSMIIYQSEPGDFLTFFKYCVVSYSVAVIVYGFIVGDIVDMVLSFFKD